MPTSAKTPSRRMANATIDGDIYGTFHVGMANTPLTGTYMRSTSSTRAEAIFHGRQTGICPIHSRDQRAGSGLPKSLNPRASHRLQLTARPALRPSHRYRCTDSAEGTSGQALRLGCVLSAAGVTGSWLRLPRPAGCDRFRVRLLPARPFW